MKGIHDPFLNMNCSSSSSSRFYFTYITPVAPGQSYVRKVAHLHYFYIKWSILSDFTIKIPVSLGIGELLYQEKMFFSRLILSKKSFGNFNCTRKHLVFGCIPLPKGSRQL